MKSVKVRVPCSTSNIGPGFDCLGCALSLYAEFTCEIIEEGLEITGCPEAYRNENNLFVQAYRYAERYMGVKPAPLRVRIETEVPVSRGLGSSSTLLAGGVTAANALNGSPLSDWELVKLCNELEGHPDNVAPAVLGGMCVSMIHEGAPVTVPVKVPENVGFIALIPNVETETRAMRAVLPKEVALQDAVFNASRLAVMLHAFREGDIALIAKALDDRLHQPYRRHLMPEYDRAEAAALEAGCAAFCISGSGSTCLAIVDVALEDAAVEKIRTALKDSEFDWRVHALKIAPVGAAGSVR